MHFPINEPDFVLEIVEKKPSHTVLDNHCIYTSTIDLKLSPTEKPPLHQKQALGTTVIKQKGAPLTVGNITVINVQVQGEKTGAITLETHGGIGKVLVEIKGALATSSVTKVNSFENSLMTLSNLAAGMYMITLQAEDGPSSIDLVLFVY